MADTGLLQSKAEAVAHAVNELVSELENRARREKEVRNYFDVAVVGYGSGSVVPLIDARRWFIPVSELRNYAPERGSRLAVRCDKSGKPMVKECFEDLWIRPRAEGATPMYEALWEIADEVKRWCADARNAESFPPVVINITDGEASDCNGRELRDACGQIRRAGTSDGRVLLMNIHITANEGARRLLFPTEAEVLSDDDRYARLLAECSSRMPAEFDPMIAEARHEQGEPPYIAMGYNVPPMELFAMLNIGSRSVARME